MNNQEPATILLIDDRCYARVCKAAFVSMAPDISVVVEKPATVSRVLTGGNRSIPIPIPPDLNMPNEWSLGNAGQITRKALSGRIVVFSVSNHEEDVVTVLKRGAGWLSAERHVEPEDPASKRYNRPPPAKWYCEALTRRYWRASLYRQPRHHRSRCNATHPA